MLPAPARRIGCLLAAFLAGSLPSAQLSGGGFESGAPMIGFPFEFGVWGVDLSSFVPAEQGVVPLEGSQMLRFLGTTLGATGVGTVGDVWNLADVEPWSALIEAGHARAIARARANRIALDACSDTRFALQLQAHPGEPANYPQEWADPIASSAIGDVYTDNDPTTWESFAIDLELPAATDMVAVIVSAVENVCANDDPPFDGHYADDVTFDVSTWIDSGSGSGGTAGAPRLEGVGLLEPATPGTLLLSNAPAASPVLVAFAIGATTPQPLFGGTVSAWPVATTWGGATTATGELAIEYVAPALPPGTLITAQAAVADASVGSGVALSNAVEGLRP